MESGTKLGHYEILSLLGKGGMGEVWRARDTKLGREVAIKTLPEEFAKDADRLARFEREAKLLASLNHSNIAAIYGLEEHEGTRFLVLELVEGDTLADRLNRGAIPVEDSLKLALQIADALKAAHDKGVIHRDLKPLNIKVTDDGKVKVLDFGLAKAFEGDGPDASVSNSPTLSMAATQQGVILGTAAYMSPEQARGRGVDKRTDVWAFGCVLYEMLTGHAAFPGNAVTDILAAVIRAEPEWAGLPADLHPRLRELIERSLEKEANYRWHDIADVRVDIQRVLADPGGVLFPQAATVVQKQKTVLPWVAATAVICLAVAGFAGWSLRAPAPGAVTRFPFFPPEGQSFTNTGYNHVAMSPDGTLMAYNADGQIFVRGLREIEARPVPGTENTVPRNLAFSPDGEWLTYYALPLGQVKRVPVNGGTPATLLSITPGMALWGLRWERDDTLWFVTSEGIWRSALGGMPELIVETGGTTAADSPQLLPDGRSLLFAITRGAGSRRWIQGEIVVEDLETGNRTTILPGGGDPRYLPTGHLVYVEESVLFAIPFDLGSLAVTGAPIPMVEGVQRGTNQTTVGAPAAYGVSDNGTLAHVVGESGGESSRALSWIDRDGREELLNAPVRAYLDPRISPDGTRVALTIAGVTNTDIWIWDLVRERLIRLTFDEAEDRYPLWTPDGENIVFTSLRNGQIGVYRRLANGTGNAERIASVPGRWLSPWSWSADEGTLLMSELALTGDTGYDIGVLSMEGDRPWTSLLAEAFVEAQPVISPNGLWMAYVSDESGQQEIYVRSFPDIEAGKWQVSSGGGTAAVWSHESGDLFYLGPDGIEVVEVEDGSSFQSGVTESLIPYRYFIEVGTQWDVAANGQRFLVIQQVTMAEGGEPGEPVPLQINIVLNWFEELKERVPVP